MKLCLFWNEISHSSSVALLQNPSPHRHLDLPVCLSVTVPSSCSLPTSFAHLAETEAVYSVVASG